MRWTKFDFYGLSKHWLKSEMTLWNWPWNLTGKFGDFLNTYLVSGQNGSACVIGGGNP